MLLNTLDVFFLYEKGKVKFVLEPNTTNLQGNVKQLDK